MTAMQVSGQPLQRDPSTTSTSWQESPGNRWSFWHVSELLPTVQAESIREGLLDYLGTTFSLADEDARAALLEFLRDPSTGIFKAVSSSIQVSNNLRERLPAFSMWAGAPS